MRLTNCFFKNLSCNTDRFFQLGFLRPVNFKTICINVNLSMIKISTSTEISNKTHIAWRIRKCVNSWKRYALPTFWTRIYIFSKRFQVFRDIISASYRKNMLILVIPPTLCFKGSEAFYTCETEVSRRIVCNIISDFTARCYYLKKV